MVSSQQRRNLEYFKNKIVTFFTSPINRDFQEKQLVDYFVGKITDLDESGIWYEHPATKQKNFIFYNFISLIAEEQVVYKSESENSIDVQKIAKEQHEVSSPLQHPKSLDDFKNLIS